MIIYFLFSIIYFIIGIYFIFDKKTAFKFFVFLTLTLPFSPLFTKYFFHYGIFTFELFYFGVLVSFFMHITKVFKIPKIFMIIIILCSIIIPQTFISTEDTIYILKDLKPFFIWLLIIITFIVLKNEKVIIKKKEISILLFLIAVKYIILYILGNYFHLSTNLSEDAFYQLHENFRYADFGLLFVIVYFIYKLVYKINFTFIDKIFIIIPVIIAQSRTIILSMLVVYFIYNLLQKHLIYKLLYLFLLPLVLISIIFLIGGRFLVLLDFNAILTTLGTRFSPFLIELSTYNLNDYILGKGIGHPFYIPWFNYRENINNYNPNIDNLYLTYYMKYGVFMIILFYLLYKTLQYFTNNKILARYLFLYFMIMSLTVAFTYQNQFAIFYYFIIYFNIYFVRRNQNQLEGHK